jgi:2-amino-4-hydroxy-6-hydroxymethyldihydropteridine diphosphokinase|tara:strand:+ start:1171 stop:1599 length:429 start_codon:yes stop_codon:yes gene_type:complete
VNKTKKNRVIISVGSNIDPLPNIKKSREILSSETIFICAADSIETAPIGYLNQANFLNTAFLVMTSLSYHDFNFSLKAIENRMGRERGPIKAGPRTIDLDIIVWNEYLITEDYYNFEYVSVPVDQVLSTMSLDIKEFKKIDK